MQNRYSRGQLKMIKVARLYQVSLVRAALNWQMLFVSVSAGWSWTRYRPRGAGHLQFSKKKKKKAELEIAPTKWKPVWISVQVMVTVWPLCWQNINSCDALVAVSVTAYRLNGASLSMLSFWSLNKLFIMVISGFFLQHSRGWWVEWARFNQLKKRALCVVCAYKTL